MKIKSTKEQQLPYFCKKYTFQNKDIVSSVYIDRCVKDIICISSMYGCPIGCLFCKSGERYLGNIPYCDIISMIDYIIDMEEGFEIIISELPEDCYKIRFINSY